MIVQGHHLKHLGLKWLLEHLICCSEQFSDLFIYSINSTLLIVC